MPSSCVIQPVSLRIGCKINLILRITGVRTDGWHALDSLFIPLPEPHDRLDILPSDRPGLRVECSTRGIHPACNTLTKAYGAFASATNFAPQATVRLFKGIPHGAGLGGGSADAAAVLRWLNAIAPEPLTETALSELAVGVGADVPFFLRNTPCRATGIGEVLTPCTTGLAGRILVLVAPPVAVSTPWAYREFDAAASSRRKIGVSALTAPGADAIRCSSIDTASLAWPSISALVNDFEAVVFPAYPMVRACKERLLQAGAEAAVMSGSGACVVGLFRERAHAETAEKDFAAARGFRVFVHALEA